LEYDAIKYDEISHGRDYGIDLKNLNVDIDGLLFCTVILNLFYRIEIDVMNSHHFFHANFCIV